MSSQSRGLSVRSVALYGLAIAGAVTLGYIGLFALIGERSVSAQSDRYLESRLNQIEQRFYQLESRLNRIEQDSITRRLPGGVQVPDTRGQDIGLLQTEVGGLRTRLGEVECAILKLDERTLPAARRLGRGGAGSDRCRQNWGEPVQLSARPY